MGINITGIKQPKAVVVFDKDDNYITTYSTLRECSRQEKIPPTSLYYAIKNNKLINERYYCYDTAK